MAEFREASKYRNSTGETGEWLAAARLGRVVKGGRNGPLFQPSFMGAKYPIVDFIVDLLDDDFKPMGMFFFAQVKSSAVADPDSERLSVTVELDDYNALAGMYLPTYLIGVDTVDDKVFIVAATEKLKSGSSTMSKRHNLFDDEVRLKLFEEVQQFWQENGALLTKAKSSFTNG